MMEIIAYEMKLNKPIIDAPNISCIPFQKQYFEAYMHIYNECFYEMRKALDIQPYNFLYDYAQIVDKTKDIYLLVDKEVIIGSVACYGNEIDDLIVNQKYRQQGYGKQLLLWAIQCIRERSDEAITLHVAAWNKKAVALYEKCGFEVVKTEKVRSIILEQLTHENYHYACEINRDDIPEEWVDTAATIMEINDYGVENHLIGHTFLARIEDKYIGLIMVGEALPWDTDPTEMKGKPFYRLMGFVVDKEFRNKGLGGVIMEKAIEQVYQEFGRRSLALGVHKDNIQAGRFYERNGFKRMGVFEGDDEYYLRLI